MGDDVDVLIVGAGLAGAASAWASARRGRSVLLVEQFAPDHGRGSSHGSARIVRRAYGDALYTTLTGRAFELWTEVEHASGTAILRLHGGLDFGAERDVAGIAGRLADAGVAHEILDAGTAEQRWAGMRFTGPVVYHAQGGTMDAASAVAAFLELAQQAGATARFDAPAVRVRAERDIAVVEFADGSSVRAACVVVAAGAWAGPLLDGLLPLPPLTVTQQQIFHFPRRDPTAPPWPSVIHQDPGVEIYHLAGGRDGGPGDDRKIGEHNFGTVTTAAARDGVVAADSRARVVDYVRRWLPGLDPTPRSAASCIYTKTPSEDFVLDRVGPVVVCSACSGHGAKFAPLLGELIANLVTGDTTVDQVPDRFRLAAHVGGRPGAVSL